MRLLQIGLSYRTYAQGAIAESIHRQVLMNGNESRVFFSDMPELAEEKARVFETAFEKVLKRILRRIFGKRQIFALPGTLRLIKMIKKYNPNIIHFHNIHHLTVDFPVLFNFLKKKNYKIIFTMHDMWNITGGCYHLTNVNCKGYLYGCHSCPKTEKELDCKKKLLKTYLKTKKDFYYLVKPGFVFVSNWLKAECDKVDFDQCNSCVIHNGVDTNVFRPMGKTYFSPKIESSKHIILGVANYWDSDKGFEQFVQLAKLLGDNYRIVLIGTPPTGITVNAIPTNMILWGKVISPKEMAHAYSSADVFVHLSKEETFGLVLAEAACCGTIPVGYESTGISEVIRMLQGELVVPDDVYGVCESVKKICSTKTRFDDEQINEIREKMSIETMARKYIEFYETILQE